jgi:hypothetical protein
MHCLRHYPYHKLHHLLHLHNLQVNLKYYLMNQLRQAHLLLNPLDQHLQNQKLRRLHLRHH